MEGTVLRLIGRTVSDTHFYGALFSAAALSFCVRHFFPSDLLAIASNATCGWFWLLVRALFHKPEIRQPVWPLALVLTMATAGVVLRFYGDSPDLVPRMIDNVQSLTSSTILLFAAIEPLINGFRDMPKTEQRFRLIFAGLYAAILTIGLILMKGAPQGSLMAQWKDPVQMCCSAAALLQMGLAIRYRDRHPVPEPGSRMKRRPPTSAENELGERLLRLMETAYALPELKLADLAERIGEADYKVTQCITGALGFRNFNQMVNHFRLAEAKRRLADPKCHHLPILTIALDCGFGSIGPFNRAFKAEMAATPTQFRKSARSGANTGMSGQRQTA